MRISRPLAAIAFGALTAMISSALGAAVEAGAAGTTADAPTAPALWTAKKLTFTFSGFTTRYSCEGLKDKTRQALLTLGARRKDLQVREGACSRPGAPEPFPSVDIKVEVLEPAPGAPADTGGTAGSTPTVAAHWKRIDLILDKDPLWQAEDCELLEQIEHRILPLFATRNVDYHSSCIAHQVSPGGTWLRAEILVADQTEPKNPLP